MHAFVMPLLVCGVALAQAGSGAPSETELSPGEGAIASAAVNLLGSVCAFDLAESAAIVSLPGSKSGKHHAILDLLAKRRVDTERLDSTALFSAVELFFSSLREQIGKPEQDGVIAWRRTWRISSTLDTQVAYGVTAQGDKLPVASFLEAPGVFLTYDRINRQLLAQPEGTLFVPSLRNITAPLSSCSFSPTTGWKVRSRGREGIVCEQAGTTGSPLSVADLDARGFPTAAIVFQEGSVADLVVVAYGAPKGDAHARVVCRVVHARLRSEHVTLHNYVLSSFRYSPTPEDGVLPIIKDMCLVSYLTGLPYSYTAARSTWPHAVAALVKDEDAR